MEAARVTGEDLRRVLEPREVQALVMSMRNGDGENARRHTAHVLRLGVDEVDELIASARRKVEQVRLRKQAQLDEIRPVEEALMDASQAGGNGRAAHSAPTPVGHRSKRLARPERLARDDDEEATVTTTAKREWEPVPLPTAREVETSADPVGTGDAESAGAASAAASAHETSPPLENAGGDSAGGESDGRSLPSRNGGDAPEAITTDPDEGSPADGSPSSETPPARDAGFVPQPCAGCGEPIGAQEASVANVGDPRRWHVGCAPPPPFAGMGPQPAPEVAHAFSALLRRSVQPERSPRERYVDVLLSKLDEVRSREDAVGPQVDEVELMDRIERQLDALE